MKKRYLNLFIIGILLILVQTFLQDNNDLMAIINDTIVSVKPFIYAIFIAILITPFVKFFEKKTKIKRSIAIALSLIIVLSVIIGLMLIIIPNIITSITELKDKLPLMLETLNSDMQHFINFLKTKKLLFFDPKNIDKNIIKYIKINIGNLKNIAFGLGLGVLKSLVGIANFFIGLFISLYLMHKREYFMKFLENILSFFMNREQTENSILFIRKINDIFLKYILGRVLTSTVVGFIVFIILFLAKVPYSLLSGVLIGVGNMIPYVGSIVAGIIATFLILLSAPYKLIYLFVAIGVGQAVDGFIIGPKIMEESVGMSSFWTIIAVTISGSFFGPLGMFLGVPFFVVIKLIYLNILRKKEKKCQNID